MWILYIIECKDEQYYTGITENLERRLKEHTHRGSHFTSYNPAVKLLYTEKYNNQIEAGNREAQIKRWSRSKKLALIQCNLSELRLLSQSRD